MRIDRAPAIRLAAMAGSPAAGRRAVVVGEYEQAAVREEGRGSSHCFPEVIKSASASGCCGKQHDSTRGERHGPRHRRGAGPREESDDTAGLGRTVNA